MKYLKIITLCTIIAAPLTSRGMSTSAKNLDESRTQLSDVVTKYLAEAPDEKIYNDTIIKMFRSMQIHGKNILIHHANSPEYDTILKSLPDSAAYSNFETKIFSITGIYAPYNWDTKFYDISETACQLYGYIADELEKKRS